MLLSQGLEGPKVHWMSINHRISLLTSLVQALKVKPNWIKMHHRNQLAQAKTWRVRSLSAHLKIWKARNLLVHLRISRAKSLWALQSRMILTKVSTIEVLSPKMTSKELNSQLDNPNNFSQELETNLPATSPQLLPNQLPWKVQAQSIIQELSSWEFKALKMLINHRHRVHWPLLPSPRMWIIVSTILIESSRFSRKKKSKSKSIETIRLFLPTSRNLKDSKDKNHQLKLKILFNTCWKDLMRQRIRSRHLRKWSWMSANFATRPQLKWKLRFNNSSNWWRLKGLTFLKRWLLSLT